MLKGDCGGKFYAKWVILEWLIGFSGGNLKLLETATGIPQNLLSSLLAEMMEEKAVWLDGVVFKPVREDCATDKIKVHRSHISARRARQLRWTRRLPRWLRRLVKG